MFFCLFVFLFCLSALIYAVARSQASQWRFLESFGIKRGQNAHLIWSADVVPLLTKPAWTLWEEVNSCGKWFILTCRNKSQLFYWQNGKNNCGCKCIAVPVRKLICLRFYVNQSFCCASFCINCWIIMSEWGMITTKTKTAFLCNTFYKTLDNKWKNNEGDEKCHKIHITPFALKIDFWNIILLKHRSQQGIWQ